MIIINQKTSAILFALLRSALDGNMLSNAEKVLFSNDLLPELWAVSNKHDIAHMIGLALNRNSLLDKSNEYSEKFRIIQLKAIYRYEQIQYEFERICYILENAHIPFLPLKGSIIRQYYPEPWMRTSCDIDILVHKEFVERAVNSLMKYNWIVQREKNYHDISLFSTSGIHLELHFNIKENISSIDTALEKVWDYTVLAEGKNYEYRLTNEFLIFHLVAHMSYHFIAGGCGIRSVVDIWILKERLFYDDNIVRSLCADAQLEIFYNSVNALIDVWFKKEPYVLLTKQMEAFIIVGGVYGITSNRVLLEQVQAGGKTKNLLYRIFMPYYKLKTQYPLLEKYKWLTPMFQVVRWCRMITKRHLRRSINELSISQKYSKAQIQVAEEFLDNIGLRNKTLCQ